MTNYVLMHCIVCEVLKLYCFIYSSYCIKLGLKQKSETPEKTHGAMEGTLVQRRGFLVSNGL